MTLFREQDPRFVHLERKVGWFIVVAMAAAALFIFFSSGGDSWFSRHVRVTFLADTAAALHEGQSATLSGIRIGEVEQIGLTESAKVRVSLVIEERYQRWIRRDSRARLSRDSAIGGAVIEITPGSQNLPEVADGGELDFEAGVSLDDVMNMVANDVRPMLVDLKALINDLRDPDTGVRPLLSRIDRIVDKTDSLLNKADVVSGKADRFIDQAGSTVARADRLLIDLDAAMPDMLARVDRSLIHLETLSQTAADKVPPMLDEYHQLAREAREVVDALTQVWPISTQVRKIREKSTKAAE